MRKSHFAKSRIWGQLAGLFHESALREGTEKRHQAKHKILQDARLSQTGSGVRMFRDSRCIISPSRSSQVPGLATHDFHIQKWMYRMQEPNFTQANYASTLGSAPHLTMIEVYASAPNIQSPRISDFVSIAPPATSRTLSSDPWDAHIELATGYGDSQEPSLCGSMLPTCFGHKVARAKHVSNGHSGHIPDNEEGSDKMGRRDSRALERILDNSGATTRHCRKEARNLTLTVSEAYGSLMDHGLRNSVNSTLYPVQLVVQQHRRTTWQLGE
ncbi:uncharacterized protein CLUP02_04544 [Colletotrichum lupini]|uniref:Uncharacterized protein n=1 Tax=Colletotrichum lupini TaxID=145971 RepID=A0A9Q8SKY3_9PEZI|nr:uncharacterized protein CLUP02_04544 [Colletotrichum lupini]UQC79065.1 hypothetical protein CLUP02_04544 [Colletotrichum lupini]